MSALDIFLLYILSILSEQAANPRCKRRCRRENDDQLQQLTFYVVSVFPVFVYAFHLRIIMLKKLKFHQQKVIKEDHIVYLVYREYRHESQKKLKESKSASESIPYGYSSYT